FDADDTSITEGQFWPDDAGSLIFDARRALLQLVRGPFITAERNSELWQALMNNHNLIKARLADLFLELVVDMDTRIAFVRNAVSEDVRLPKAVKNLPLTLVDTVMVLTLRKELLIDASNRVFVGRDEIVEQLANYRPVTKLDEAAFKSRLDTSWGRLVTHGILQPSETEGRYEISPVLKLIFGADEVRAINEEFTQMLEEYQNNPEGFRQDGLREPEDEKDEKSIEE
ncbi:MAG: DUF4194 domain-containing protein, partial [Coriobacteriia bacterium]|nr:DUF4194 domain-containing protein [Coriobacteriia bacterium]